MARFCTNCGHELPEGKGFCPECGVPVTEETVIPPGPDEGMPPPPQAPQPPQSENSAPRQEASAPKPAQPAPGAPTASKLALESILAAKPESPVVSTIGFFGLEFLYKIPFVSFICSIVLSIAPKNKNIRHHAQAKLIWKIVGFVLLLGVFLLVGAGLRTLWNTFSNAFTEATGKPFSFSGLQELDPSQLGDLQSILEQYGIEGVDGLDDLQGLMQQYGIEDIGSLGDIQGMLQQYGIEDMGDLQNYLQENGIYEGLPGD